MLAACVATALSRPAFINLRRRKCRFIEAFRMRPSKKTPGPGRAAGEGNNHQLSAARFTLFRYADAIAEAIPQLPRELKVAAKRHFLSVVLAALRGA